MKRRNFVGAMGALCVMGLVPPTSARPMSRNPLRPVAPLFECLPDVLSRACPTPTASIGGAVDLDWDLNLYPLLIGLGARAERFLEHLASSRDLPMDAGLYRPGAASIDAAAGWLDLRLQKTAIAMLLVDPDEPAALQQATDWAQRLVEAEVYLPVAVVFASRTSAVVTAWRSSLPLPVIELPATDPVTDCWPVIEAMLPGLPFHQPTLVGVDLSDTRSVLRAGSRAVATAVRWRKSDSRARALDQAWASLPPILPAGVLAWVTASAEYSIHEFDATLTLLDNRLGPSVTCLLAPYIDPSFAVGDRMLSLTIVGT